jgi:hypothetical protein
MGIFSRLHVWRKDFGIGLELTITGGENASANAFDF